MLQNLPRTQRQKRPNHSVWQPLHSPNICWRGQQKRRKSDPRAGQVTNAIPNTAGSWWCDTRLADIRGQTTVFAVDKVQRKGKGPRWCKGKTLLSCIWWTVTTAGIWPRHRTRHQQYCHAYSYLAGPILWCFRETAANAVEEYSLSPESWRDVFPVYALGVGGEVYSYCRADVFPGRGEQWNIPQSQWKQGLRAETQI